ncbi:tetratricopeptide repeat protein [Jannaschia helgolandensis]
MAQANIGLGRLNQAERLLREAVAEEPRNAPAMNNLGVVLMELGQTGEAHRVFRTAFALQPSPEILENLRVSGAKIENSGYTQPQDNAFTLTRGDDGIYGLNSPEQFP